MIGGDKFEWVAASGVRAISNITIPLGNQDQRSYTVRLHFVEPDQKRKGERVFDVALQGKTMLKNFDIVSEAGSSNVAVVKEFSPVTAADSLSVSLIPSASSKTSETILCGIELIAEGW